MHKCGFSFRSGPCLAWFLMLTVACPSWSQDAKGARLDSLFSALKANKAVQAIKASGDSLMEVGKLTQDCESELLGTTIYATYNVLPIEELDALIDSIDCPIVGYQANNAFASRYYLNQDYQRAMEWFERAEHAASTQHEAMACAIAIGACHSGLGNNVEAFRAFNQAYNIADHPAPMILLNNLAASQITFGLYDDALELLDEALSHEGLSRYELQLIRLNRLDVYCNTGELEQARTEYKLLREVFPKRLDATAFRVLLNFALELDSSDHWLELKSELEDALTYLDHDFVFAEGHPGRLLFDAYEAEWNELGIPDEGDSRWRSVKSLTAAHNKMRLDVAKKLLEERNALAESTFSNEQIGLTPKLSFPWWAFVLLLAGAGGIGTILLRKAKQHKHVDHDDDVTELSLINRVTSLMEHEQEDLDLIEVLNDLRGGVLESVQAQLNTLIKPSHELTKMERQALAFFILGYSPKQVAVLLDRSVGYIYNTRTLLRKKLEMKKSTDFDNWYAQSQHS